MKMFEFRSMLKEKAKSLDIDSVDIDYLIADVLNVSRTDLVLIDEIDEKNKRKILKLAKKRFRHIPIDKILKHTYFYGYEFTVDENVLTPRQDSEILVDTALDLIKENSYNTLLDMCTGSGCLAISIKKNVDILVDAVDISKKALKVAKKNAKQNAVDIRFIHSNMFSNVDKSYDLIISNPPYIATEEIASLDKEVRSYDPRLALDGGADGLKFYRKIYENLSSHLNDNGMVILEIGEGQSEDIKKIFSNCSLVSEIKDYNGIIRCLAFKLKERL